MAVTDRVELWYHCRFADQAIRSACKTCYDKYDDTPEMEKFTLGLGYTYRINWYDEGRECFFCKENMFGVVIVNHLDFEEGQG